MKTTIALILATLAGFCGGVVHSALTHDAGFAKVMRAERYELLDQRGKVVASWSHTSDDRVVLQFNNRLGRAVISVGTQPSGTPSLVLFGSDGRPRVGLNLDHGEDPALYLSDRATEARIIIGRLTDDFSSNHDNIWGLSIRAPRSGDPRASILVKSAGMDSGIGMIDLKADRGRRWRSEY